MSFLFRAATRQLSLSRVLANSKSAQSETSRLIEEVIEDKIRPIIQEDGGDLEYLSYEDKIVKVRLQGACRTCPSSTITLKNGIKTMLQFHFPEIEDVIHVPPPTDPQQEGAETS